jgi:DNA polymerase-3 subunit epsilon
LASLRGKREIVLDIKTTGANPRDGDRLISIGCVELFDRIPSGNAFHAYFNPERGVPAEAFAAHGLSEDFLKDKPFFAEAADDLIAFLGYAPLVSHNPVSFDLGFLNAELERCGRSLIARERFVYKKIDGDAAHR